MGRAKKRLTYGKLEWEGQEYRIAKSVQGVALPIEEKIQITKVLCLMYKTDDYALEKCCEAVGITAKTFFNWRSSFSEISEIYLDADREKEIIYKDRLRIRGRTTAERLTEGFVIELQDYDLVPVLDEETKKQLIGEDGEPVYKKANIRVRQQYIRPSVKMTETILYNTDVRVFEKNPKPVEKINQDVDIPLIDWVE